MFLGGHPKLEMVQNWITKDLRNYARGYRTFSTRWFAGMPWLTSS